MISVEKAFSLYGQKVVALESEIVPLERSLGRTLASEATSRIDLPPFSQSAMDGYALRADDVKNASKNEPVRLRIVDTVAAGSDSFVDLASGQAARIMTGGRLPGGADAVVRQELVLRSGEDLVLDAPVPAGNDVRARAEEIGAGERLAQAGATVTAGMMASLANTGMARVEVVRRPRIGVLVTGDELTPVGSSLGPGRVYDSNTHLTRSWLQSQGIVPTILGRVDDDMDTTVGCLQEAFEACDAVVTTGGVSVGDRDYVVAAAKKLDVEQVFWRVRQKPGKPLFFGMLGEKPLIGLPGNPGSVFVGLALHVRRVVDLLSGASEPGPSFEHGVLAADASASAGRTVWLRARLKSHRDGRAQLEPLPRQGSHMLSNLADCQALVRLPEQDGPVRAGTVLPFTRC